MNKFIINLVFFLMINNLSFSQSILKFCKGNIEQVSSENIKTKIFGINKKLNDSSLLLISDYIIVENSGILKKITNKEYPSGFRINELDFNDKKQNNGFWDNVYSIVFGHKFANKMDFDGLKMTSILGTTRDLNLLNHKKMRVSPEFDSSVEWKGKKIFIKNNEKIIFAKKTDGIINFGIGTLKDCENCNLYIDDIKKLELISIDIDFKNIKLLKRLLQNIDNKTDVEFSQFCIVQFFLSNQLYLNALYFKEEFKENELLKSYFEEIIWQ